MPFAKLSAGEAGNSPASRIFQRQDLRDGEKEGGCQGPQLTFPQPPPSAALSAPVAGLWHGCWGLRQYPGSRGRCTGLAGGQQRELHTRGKAERGVHSSSGGRLECPCLSPRERRPGFLFDALPPRKAEATWCWWPVSSACWGEWIVMPWGPILREHRKDP